MSNPKFKVIVIGGGPVGLTAAHALSQAGIDYVVLENRLSVTTDVGASLVLWPHGLRVLAQLGLLKPLREISVGMCRTQSLTLDGEKYRDSHVLDVIKNNHGSRQTIFHRAHLLRVLHENLSEADKACILTGKKVTDIVVSPDGVEARCADGSTYHGSIIIGADGTHSKVRQSMRELALKASASKVNKEQPYLSEYRALWCTFPRQAGFETGDAIDIHGDDVSLQCIVGQDRSWIFLYERLETPTGDRVTYSRDDVEAFAARFGEHAISEHLKVKDVFEKRYTAGMANLEEGIVKHWSWNRIVLVGDACHKFTPNQGLGYNNGIQDVARLVSELHRIVPVDNSASLPVGTLTKAFSRYQTSRMKAVRKDLKSSAGTTRMSVWSSWTYYVLDRHLLPSLTLVEGKMVSLMMGSTISKGPILDFMEGEEPFEGKVPWKNRIAAPKKSTPKALYP
ncbi:hypothetical protein B0T25DRAFT_186068 [Lasiosphaeria hispida]|uniref:FAD-binding domain-containing protein n=1 Tax=Lasiosphaeria hispida TaxID=260671 RepID=A0AAJ0MDG9_9PEZI|nr:hypothetical protein B0T25DRAFT_186068 [Lasiosphaeria hispida]